MAFAGRAHGCLLAAGVRAGQAFRIGGLAFGDRKRANRAVLGSDSGPIGAGAIGCLCSHGGLHAGVTDRLGVVGRLHLGGSGADCDHSGGQRRQDADTI